MSPAAPSILLLATLCLLLGRSPDADAATPVAADSAAGAGAPALERCTAERRAGGAGGPPSGVCPAGNTCCPLTGSDGGGDGWGCIPDDMPGPPGSGVCCGDGDGDDVLGTGCAPGYVCVPPGRSPSGSRGADELLCERPDGADPLVRTMRRYRLCSPPVGTLEAVHGLPIVPPADATNPTGGGGGEGGAERAFGEIAYYSSHGDVLRAAPPSSSDGTDARGAAAATPPMPLLAEIRAALVVVHGQNRNADGYYCSATRAAALRSDFDSRPSRSVLVLAPRFLQLGDGPVELTSGGTALRWGDDGSGGRRDAADAAGVWRYGADAIYPPPSGANDTTAGVSSFDVMDAMVRSLADRVQFPNLELITIAGHSSGGQYVQRWALLSSSGPWEEEEEEAVAAAGRPHLRAVVANPSSYAYLDGRRFVGGSFRVPPGSIRAACPDYDGWEWGLSTGPTDVRYKREAIDRAGGPSVLARRYAARDVVYVSGAEDRCNVSSAADADADADADAAASDEKRGGGGWCYSHGLETTCMDDLQGSQRLERSARYFAYLGEYFGGQVHRRVAVPLVGHDHSLIFASEGGLRALFGDTSVGRFYMPGADVGRGALN